MVRAGLLVYRRTRATVAAIGGAIADARAEVERDRPVPERAAAREEVEPNPEAAARKKVGLAREGAARDRVEPPSAPEAIPRAGGGALARRDSEPGRGGMKEVDSDTDEPSSLSAATALRLVVLLLLPMAIAAAGAFAVAAQGERVYAARSEVVFDLRNLAWGSAERFLGTQVAVAQSRALLAPVADRFGVPVPDLERELTVETLADSAVIRVQYTHPDRLFAQDVTQAITDRYLLTLREFEQLEGAGHRLLTPAFVLEEPVAPKPLRAAAIGALIGLAIGIAGAIVRGQAWPLRQS